MGQYRPAPVTLLWRGDRAEELHAKRRGVIGHQVQPLPGLHRVGQAGFAHRAIRDAPERFAQPREQPETGQGQRQAEQHQPADAAQLAFEGRWRCLSLQVCQALQGEQCDQAGQHGQRHRQRALVEQERRERAEQPEADQAAGIAQAAQLAGFQREHCCQQRAAGVAARPWTHLPVNGGQHGEHQQQAQGARQQSLPRGQRGQQCDTGDDGGQHGGQLQQQRQQAQRRAGQRPVARTGTEQGHGPVSHEATAPVRAGTGGDGRCRCQARAPVGPAA